MLKITKETINDVFRPKLRYMIEPTILAETYYIKEDGTHVYHVKLWYIPISTVYQVTETKYDNTRNVIYLPFLDDIAKIYNRIVEGHLYENNMEYKLNDL